MGFLISAALRETGNAVDEDWLSSKIWGQKKHCHSFVRSLPGKSPLLRLPCSFELNNLKAPCLLSNGLVLKQSTEKQPAARASHQKGKESIASRGWMCVRNATVWSPVPLPDLCALSPQRTPWFNGWGFNLPRGQSLLDKWNLIPEGIDILMTHGPPLGKWSKGCPLS